MFGKTRLAYKMVAFLLCLSMSMISPFSSVAAGVTSGSSVNSSESDNGGSWKIKTELYSGWGHNNEEPTLMSGTTARFQVDYNAFVTQNDNGTYHVKIGFASYSIYDMIQVLNPTKMEDARQYCRDNSISIAAFPLGTFNAPVEADDYFVPGNYETIKAKLKEEVNEYYFTEDEVNITCKDQEMDWGIIEFDIDNFSQYTLINPCYSARTSLTPLIIGFDEDSIEEIPDDFTYESGVYSMGYEYTNYAYAAVKSGSRNDSISTLNFFNNIFLSSVEVSINNDGELTGVFTVNVDFLEEMQESDPITAIEIADTRDMTIEGNPVDYALLIHEMIGTNFTEIEIFDEDKVTISFKDLTDGKLIRVRTKAIDDYNAGRSATNSYKYYWARLYLKEDVQEIEEVVVTAENGAVLKTDSSTFKDGYKFVCEDNWDEANQASLNAVKAYAVSDDSYHIYSYWIEDGEGNRIVPSSSVTIDLPIPTDYNIETTLYAYTEINGGSTGYDLPKNISEVIENDDGIWVVRLTPENMNKYDYEITLYDAGTDITDEELSLLTKGKYYEVRPALANISFENRPSMSSGIIAGNTGILHVTDEGEYEIYVTLQGVLVEPDYGYVSKMYSSSSSGWKDTETLSYKSTADLRDVEWDKLLEADSGRVRDDENLNIDEFTDEYNLHYLNAVKIPLVKMDSNNRWMVSLIVPLMNSRTGADITTTQKQADLRLISGTLKEVDIEDVPTYNTSILLAAIEDAQWYLDTMEGEEAKTILSTAISNARIIYEELKNNYNQDTLLEAVAVLQAALEAAGGGSTNDKLLSSGTYSVPYKIYDAGVETETESSRSVYFDGTAKLTVEGDNMTVNLYTQEDDGDAITLLRYDNGLRLAGAETITDDDDTVIGYTFTREYTEDSFELEIYTTRYNYANPLMLDLDFYSAKKNTASEEEIAELTALIEELQKLDGNLYTQSTWDALDTAINNALMVLSVSDYLEYDTLQKQIAVLTAAKDNLVLVTDLPKLLADALERANTYKDKADIYTEASMTELTTAIDKGQAVYDNYEAAVESEVEAAIEALEAAIDGLESIRYLALKALVESIQANQSADYTEATWTVFEKTLEEAKAVLDEESPSEDDLQNAYDALKQAADTLVLASREELKVLLSQQDELNEADYTADSWNAYQSALEVAQEVYDSENSGKTDYDAAVEALKQAQENLESVQTESLEELKSLITQLTEKLSEEDAYESTSYAAFCASLAASEDIVENADNYKLTAEQITAQADALSAEYNALILLSELQTGNSTAAAASRSFSRISYDALETETVEADDDEDDVDDDEILIENDLITDEEEEAEEETTSATAKETEAATQLASEQEIKAETESTAAEKETETVTKDTEAETVAETKAAEKETEKETEAKSQKETDAEDEDAQADVQARATTSPFRLSAVTSSASTASASNASAASAARTTTKSVSTYETDVEDGIYCVNYVLWQFAANKESMGNPALCDAYPEKSGKQAKIKVEDGNVYLYVELQAMEFGGDTGHLLEMFIMNNLVTDEEGIVIESYTELYPEVVEYTDETDNYGPPAGSKYPKLLKFDITKWMVTQDQYIPVMVNVPVMGASAEQPAYLRCYWSTFALVESSVDEDPEETDDDTVTLDTEALEAAISKVSTTKKSDYTTASYEALTRSVLAAAAVKMDGLGASQEMVDNRTDALLKTYAALIPVSENNGSDDTSLSEAKAELFKVLQNAYSSYSERNYTADSWEVFSRAREEALLAYINSDATYIEVILARQTLETSITDLKEAAVVDKTKLSSLISQAQNLTYSDYTEASWIQVATALTLARVIYRDDSATQTEVDAQAKELQNAINNLQAASTTSGSGSSSSGSSSSGTSNSDEENGYYSIKVRLWHSSLNKASMGDDAVENKAYVMIKDGEATMRLVTKKMTVSGITAHLHDFWIYIDGGYKAASLISTEDSRWIYEFDLPNTTATYYKCQVDPQVEVMGYDPVNARLKVDWDSINDIDVDDWDSLAGDVDDDDDSSSSSAGTSVVSSYTTELIDKLTGVRVQGSTGGPSIKLSVTHILEGADFEHANSVLEFLTNQFMLYDICLLDGEQTVQPTGAVTLKIPIPEGYNMEQLVLYRFNDDGTLEQIYGQINGSFYEASVNHFSYYALAESSQALTAINTGNSVIASGGSGSSGSGNTGNTGSSGAALGSTGSLSSTAAIQVAGGRIIPYTGDDTPVAAWMGFGLTAAALWLSLALTEKRGRRS